MTKQSPENLEHLRHSLAHLLAAAVQELYPDAKRAIGPAIENGFYYDFEFAEPMTESDLPKIEKRMREILKTWKGFERKEVTAIEAKKLFANEPYKLELIEEFSKGGQTLTTYLSGAYLDLCRGGHIDDIGVINPHAFKLSKTAGAYWRGSEKNPMLTRIYGLAFATPEELKAHQTMLAEAEKRDHRKIGAQLDLFMFHETSPGIPYWLPKGLTVLNELIAFWREEHTKNGYQEIKSPLLNRKDLYETSGHWEHYKDDMFIADMGKGEEYGLKPMNCPNAMIVFGRTKHSYRELPLRLSDTDALHRYERSGTLNGLLRVRGFHQDDAHIFLAENQIAEEYRKIFWIAYRFYGIFDIDFSYRLGTRPEQFLGDKKTWDRAEQYLREMLETSSRPYTVLEGDGAFYGPKIDILMKDALGREWQMGTIQLDFQLPRRFKLSYVDSKGKDQTPVVIHRVIYGSLERFIGILLEHTSGSLPLWLSPVQAAVIPVGSRHISKATEIFQELQATGLRVEISDAHETVGKKIREATKSKIPYIIVIGDQELKGNKLAVRIRGVESLLSIELASLERQLARAIFRREFHLPYT